MTIVECRPESDISKDIVGTSQVRIGAAATAMLGDRGSAAKQFASQRAILCDGAIEDAFLAMLLGIVSRAKFRSDPVEALGRRDIETPAIAGGAISLALNRREMLDWAAAVARCGPLASVEGRVVRTSRRPDDRLRWHDDLDDVGTTRRLGITIGLTAMPYDGGMFELREKASHSTLFRHRHGTPGQALIFDVVEDVEHRLEPVTAGGPRCVYTGWFVRSAEE